MFKRILVSADGSATSDQGVVAAASLARSLSARLTVLHVVDTRPVYADFAGINDSSQMIASQCEAGEKVLAKARALAEGGGLEIATRLVESSLDAIPPVIAHVAQTEQADLIVMGTHGRSGISHLLLGSVAEGVLRAADVPVLLIRDKG